MLNSVVSTFVPDRVRALGGGAFSVKHRLKQDLWAVRRESRLSPSQKDNKVISKAKKALKKISELVPEDQPIEFKQHFLDVLQIIYDTECGGQCLIFDNERFRSKAAKNPKIKHNISVDSKGNEMKHLTWTPTRGSEMNVVFAPEIADVSFTPAVDVVICFFEF